MIQWNPEILGMPVMPMSRAIPGQGHKYLQAIPSLDAIRTTADLILDLIPASTLVLILVSILAWIHAPTSNLPLWLWTGTFPWETAGQPTEIQGQPSRSMLPQDLIRMELSHPLKLAQFHVVSETNLKCTSTRGLANRYWQRQGQTFAMLPAAAQIGWTTIHEAIADVVRTHSFARHSGDDLLLKTQMGWEPLWMVRPQDLGWIGLPKNVNLTPYLSWVPQYF